MKLITLKNGLKVIMEKREDLRSATLGVWVAAGSRYEGESEKGISHFIEHIVFKGSNKRTAFEIAEGFDSIGASVNAYTTKEYTFFYTKALDYQIENAAHILFDMVKNPKLSEKDIETEKGVIYEEIAMCEDDPYDVCYELNESGIYEGQSISSPILGTKESLASLKSGDFKRYMKKFYVPERTVVGICGNFDEEKILSVIEEYFGKDENTGFTLCEKELTFGECYTLKKRGFEQNHIMITFEGVGIEHEDLYKLMVCSFILGSGTSSRLNQRIREELGLVYEISSYLSRFHGGGYICIHMSLTADSEEKGIAETCKIIKNLSSSLTEKELSVAKEKLTASLIMSREQPQSKLSYLGHCQLFLDKFIEDDDIIEKIRSVTLKDVSEVAEKYLDLKKASFTAVGNVKDKNFYEGIIKGE